MTEGVAEVEVCPHAGLTLIGGHHSRLDAHGGQNGARQRLGLAGQQRRHVDGHLFQIGAVGNGTVLDDFGQAGGQLTRRQGLQCAGVGHDQPGLVEGPHHVLAARVVDAGLAAHGGVDLRQQAGGHLHEVNAALEAGGRKAGQITHHATAQRHDQALAVQPGFQHAVMDGVELLPALAGLAGRHHDAHHLVCHRGQQRLDLRAVDRVDVAVGDDGHRAAACQRLEGGILVQQAVADLDVVAAFAEIDGQDLGAGHGNLLRVACVSAHPPAPEAPARWSRRSARWAGGWW